MPGAPQPRQHRLTHTPGGPDPVGPVDSLENDSVWGVRSVDPVDGNETEGLVLTATGDGGSTWSATSLEWEDPDALTFGFDPTLVSTLDGRGVTLPDAVHVGKFTLATGGTLSELHGYFTYVTGGPQIKICVYTDSAGAPGSLVAVTSAISVPVTPLPGDVTLGETGLGVPITAGTYWLGVIGNDNNADYRYLASSVPFVARISGFSFASPPSTFGTPDVTDVRTIGCWGVVVP